MITTTIADGNLFASQSEAQSDIKNSETKLEAEISKALKIFKSDRPFEIRSFLQDGQKLAGYYDKTETAAKDIVSQLDRSAKAVYFVLNEISEDHLKKGKIKQRSVMVKDSDILHRNWIFIDIDPVRPAKTNATDEEKKTAEILLDNIINFLRDAGFPKPIVTDSGNGFHAYFKVNLSNTPENKNLIYNFLKVLDEKFSNEAAKVDTTVYNAGRITKVPGTMTRKGPHTDDRPQRRSLSPLAPEKIETLSQDTIKVVTGLLKPSYNKTKGSRAEVIKTFNKRYLAAEVLNRFCKREGSRFISPRSTSGDPGIVILNDGRFYSHHDSDGLSEHSHSPYDALVEYGHTGNDEAGLSEACKLLKMELKTPVKTLTKRRQGNTEKRISEGQQTYTYFLEGSTRSGDFSTCTY